jgi:RimJ/RimL family protein N-acetyltransferase
MYEGKLVRLRALEWQDAERYREWINDAGMATLVDRARPVTLAEHQRWYERLTHSDSVLMFAVDDKVTRRFIGCAWLNGIDRRHRRAEVRIVLGIRGKRGRGRGADAIRTLAAVAFNRMNLEKVYAEVLESNDRAVRAFEAAGFRREGLLRQDRWVDGKYQNVVRYGLLRHEQGN